MSKLHLIEVLDVCCLFNLCFFILVTPQVISSAMPGDIPKPVQGQQVILTPTGGGLSTVALSQVLLPGTSPITNAANSQPIYFTTQVLPPFRPLLDSIHHSVLNCVN